MNIKSRSFHDHLIRSLTEAEAQLVYCFAGLRKLIDDKGAVAAAIQLLDISRAVQEQDGFTILAENNLLHLSLEQAVIDFAESGLFPASIIASARSRLLLAKNRMKRRAK
jgi:hypothetical protein